jgi:hypothetical protein
MQGSYSLEDLNEARRKKEKEIRDMIDKLDCSISSTPKTMQSIAKMHRHQLKQIKRWYESQRAVLKFK